MATLSLEDRLAKRRGDLAHLCEVEPVKQHLRLVGYYQIARQLFQQTEAYVQDQAWDQAYVYLARFIKLCSKVIPVHHEFKKPRYQKERDWIGVQAQHGLALFDVILKGMEDNEVELMKEEHEQEQERLYQQQRQLQQRRASPPPAVPSRPVPSAPPAQLSLEDRLAALRLQKADEEQQQHQQRQTRESARSVESRRFRATHVGVRDAQYVPSTEPRLAKSSVSYPSVQKAHWMQESKPHGSSVTVSLSPPQPRPRKPVSRQFSQEAVDQLSSGRLRDLEIPTTIISQFTAIAEPNTRKYPDGIETCGILAGKLHGTRLIITTLIIPKQEGSSDMCTMKNEEELFDYCFSNELLTLGWIHTHPRQSCFLSSVDIHTQCGLQSILPEAIAIVVAPTDMRQNVGVFRLTEPGGMQLIQQCTLTGFHVHPDHIQIYSDALACEWNSQRSPAVVDMR